MITNRQAARNISGFLVRAAWAKRRGRINRPPTSISPTVTKLNNSVHPSAASPASCAIGPIAPRKKMIGTIATSWNRRMPSAALPTGVLVPDIGRTSAVEDRASARPRPKAPIGFWPRATSAPAISNPQPISSAAPTPNTVPRICHKRFIESSRPIEKSSRTMPNSAKGSIASRSEMVTWTSHGTRSVSEPRPDGPTTTPTMMKPIIGVMRKRAKSGITMPAAPNITSAFPNASDSIAWIMRNVVPLRCHFVTG